MIADAKKKVLELTQSRPVIVSLDTLEHYDVDDEPIMRAIAALIECASRFNTLYSRQGIHIKLFMSAEVFPHLVENVITNPSKYVRNPVYLHWRPKDLIRLLCWRFYRYLEVNNLLQAHLTKIKWDDFSEVLKHVWIPHFGQELLNGRGVTEKTFPYILRHTR